MKQQEDQHHIERSSEAVTDSGTRQVRSILEYLSKWKNFPVEVSTWEDDNFIQKHQEIIKRWGQHLFEGEGMLGPYITSVAPYYVSVAPLIVIIVPLHY